MKESSRYIPEEELKAASEPARTRFYARPNMAAALLAVAASLAVLWWLNREEPAPTYGRCREGEVFIIGNGFTGSFCVQGRRVD